jgi:hypothetical protein
MHVSCFMAWESELHEGPPTAVCYEPDAFHVYETSIGRAR